MEKQKGLRCEIYKWNLGDCSAGGISSNHTQVTLIGPNVPQIFEVTEDAPAVVILKRDVYPGEPPYHYAQPVGLEKQWTMAGGSFIYSCDSRFPFKYPLSLHDRVESWTK